MNESINLLRSKPVSVEKSRSFKIFRTVSFIFLGAAVVFTLLLFVLQLVLGLSNLKSEHADLLHQLSKESEKELKYVFVFNEIKDIQKLLNTRLSYDETIHNFVSNAPSQISIHSLSINEKKVIFTATSTSLIAVSSFFDSLSQPNSGIKNVKNVSLTDFSADPPKGNYSFTIAINLL